MPLKTMRSVFPVPTVIKRPSIGEELKQILSRNRTVHEFTPLLCPVHDLRGIKHPQRKLRFSVPGGSTSFRLNSDRME